jgi:hypothetical protein
MGRRSRCRVLNALTREIIEFELEVARERDEEIPVSDAGHVVIGTVTVAREHSRPQSA